jgi:DNA-nicking Smr family endonuclease
MSPRLRLNTQIESCPSLNRQRLTSYPPQSKEAYSSGDGAGAKQLSEEGKAHGRKMEEYNKQASEFIFRENNASGRVADDTIDLHGQFVEEAEEILEERIKYAKSHGQNHLHVYVLFSSHII